MRLVFSTQSFAVFDDVLTSDESLALWHWFQVVPMTPLDKIDYGHNIVADGRPLFEDLVKPLMGPHILSSRAPASGKTDAIHYPTKSAIDALFERIEAELPQLRRWVGTRGEHWSHIAATPWIYPGGTSLSWHQDAANYHGAFAYYAHPDWNVLWGGELLIAQRGEDEPPLQPQFRFDNEAFSASVIESGVGHFVLPKPNRMVVIGPKSLHMVTPVRAGAGLHVRASIGGFFDRRPSPA